MRGTEQVFAYCERLEAELEATRARARALAGEVERLAADRVRLDWIEANRVGVDRDPADYGDRPEWELVAWQDGVGRAFDGDTLREAIDNAMKGAST